MKSRNRFFLISFATLALSISSPAQVVFFTDQNAWLAAVQNVETFLTSSTNVGLANEVNPAPLPNAQLGPILTFDQANTGLSRSFRVQTLQLNAGFTFSDHEGGPVLPNFDAALSVGDVDNFEDDDWRLTLTAGASSTAFGFILRENNNNVSGESFSVYGASGLLGSVVPPASDTQNFLGFTSVTPWTYVQFDEDVGPDDIAIADFRFANAIPEPSSALLVMTGLAALVLRKRRA